MLFELGFRLWHLDFIYAVFNSIYGDQGLVLRPFWPRRYPVLRQVLFVQAFKTNVGQNSRIKSVITTFSINYSNAILGDNLQLLYCKALGPKLLNCKIKIKL